MYLSAVCSLLRAEGFFYNLDVLYGGLGIGKLKFFIPKNINFFKAANFSILIVKTLDPDPDWYSD
jgi:hypothetical protein